MYQAYIGRTIFMILERVILFGKVEVEYQRANSPVVF